MWNQPQCFSRSEIFIESDEQMFVAFFTLMESQSMSEDKKFITNILQRKFPMIYEPELREKIADVATMKSVDAGDVIIDKGQYIKSVPLVVEGSIKVLRDDEFGHELFLYFVDASNTCAMSLTCCLADVRSNIKAVAEDDASMLFIPVHYMDEWMAKYPSWKSFVMGTYAARFEELLKTIDLIAFHNMDDRLLSYLKKKAKAQESNTLNVTHKEIATELSSSREAISRLLKQLEKMGHIKLHRNRIELVDLV